MESEDKLVTTTVVQTESANLRAVFKKTGKPSGGAGALALVELESEKSFKAATDNPDALGQVELVSEKKPMTTAIVQTETAAARDLALGAGMAQETGEHQGETPGAAGALALVELKFGKVFKADTDNPTHLGRSSWSPRTSR